MLFYRDRISKKKNASSEISCYNNRVVEITIQSVFGPYKRYGLGFKNIKPHAKPKAACLDAK